MSNFNFYLNRQGIRGRQGEKGDKGDQGYSPYIEIKSDTPTEFIMTIHNENESFDTPNLIPQSIGNKVTELDARLTTAESTIADHTTELETLNTNYSTLNRDLADTDSRVTDLNTKYIAIQGSVNNINSEVNDLSSGKQNKLVEGENITLTNNADGTTTISSTGGGSGSGDVTAAGNNTFTGSNTFKQSIRINNSTDPYLSTFINSNGIGIQNTDSGEITVRNNMTPVPLKITASKLTLSTNNTNEVDILTSDSLEAGDNVTLNKNITTGVITISAAAGSSSLDEFISGSTNDNTTTISVKDGKALKLDAPTVIVGDNLVNTTDPEQMQLFLKQNDVAQGDNIVVDKTATGVKISTTNTVTTNTNQSISGIKTFNNGKLKIGENTSSQIEFQASRSGNTLINRIIANRIEPYAGNSSGVIIKGAARNTGSNPSGYRGDVVDNTDPQYYLADNDIIAGDGITISKTVDTTNKYSKITISSAGGATPENVVTTDTDQTITGNKTFTGNQGVKVGSINTYTNISKEGLDIVNSNTSVLNITSSGTYASGYTTTLKGHKHLTITNSNSSGNITVSPFTNELNAFKYKSSYVSSAPTYDILHTGNLTAGDNIIISEPNTLGVRTISAMGGGGSAPTNMVTTDMDQTILGTKTFKNPTGTSFEGTSSNSNTIIIDGDDKTIRFNSLNAADAVIKNSGRTDSKLKIGENFERVQITTNLYDKSGNLISGGGGSIPENMVTTDTVQDITAYKTFSGGLQTTTLNASTGVRTSANIDLLQNISGATSATKASIQPVMTDGLMEIDLKTGTSDGPDETGNYKKGKATYNGTEILKNDLSNISDVGSTACAHYAMPSRRYIDVTLGASGATYTAPADGYVAFSFKATGDASIQILYNIQANLMYSVNNLKNGQWARGYLPVSKGKGFTLEYIGEFVTKSLKFVYVEGTPSA